MSTLQPGQIVQHPEHGVGFVQETPLARFVHYGASNHTAELTGWERAETCTADERAFLDRQANIECVCSPYHGGAPEEDCPQHGRTLSDWAQLADAMRTEVRIAGETLRPGHVQVRVDDLAELGTVALSWATGGASTSRYVLLKRIGAAILEWRATQVLDEQPTVSDAASRFTPGPKAETPPTDDEQPTSATVTLPCPDCGENITGDVQLVDTQHFNGRERTISAYPLQHHPIPCTPAQPDEPTSFGARVQVTRSPGDVVKWVRVADGCDGWIWEDADGESATWGDLCALGPVQIGWDD